MHSKVYKPLQFDITDCYILTLPFLFVFGKEKEHHFTDILKWANYYISEHRIVY